MGASANSPCDPPALQFQARPMLRARVRCLNGRSHPAGAPLRSTRSLNWRPPVSYTHLRAHETSAHL
eukprot:3825781-Alexandrium_andersonii.AAC.1